MSRNIIVLIAIATILILGCGTDVPLSFSGKIVDSRLIGYWQCDDSTAMQIKKVADDYYTSINLGYDKDLHKYVIREDKDAAVSKLYFTSLKDGAGTVNFMSIKFENVYFTNKISIDNNGDLVTTPISDAYLTSHCKIDKDSIVIFGTPENYQRFITAHMRDPLLYGESEKPLKKKQSLKELNIPSITKPTKKEAVSNQ